MTLHLQGTQAARAEPETAMEDNEHLALVLSRNPTITAAAGRILRRLPGYHVQTVKEPLDAVSPETLGALALAEVLVFEAETAALAQGDPVGSLLSHRGATTRTGTGVPDWAVAACQQSAAASVQARAARGRRTLIPERPLGGRELDSV